MATHSSVLACRIPGMGEPGGLRSMGCPVSDTTEVTAAATEYGYLLFVYFLLNLLLKFLPILYLCCIFNIIAFCDSLCIPGTNLFYFFVIWFAIFFSLCVIFSWTKQCLLNAIISWFWLFQFIDHSSYMNVAFSYLEFRKKFLCFFSEIYTLHLCLIHLINICI